MSQQINLFNPMFLKQRKYFSAKTMAQALGIILFVSLAFQGLLLFQSAKLERQKIEAQALHRQVQQQMLQLVGTGARSRSKLLEDEISRVEGMIKAQQDVVSILEGGNFGNSQGYSRFLIAFARQRTSGLWLTGFTVNGTGEELSIRGRVLRADLVAQYIRQLSQEAAMRGHVIAELNLTRVEEPRAAAAHAAISPPQRYIEFALSTGKGGDKPVRP